MACITGPSLGMTKHTKQTKHMKHTTTLITWALSGALLATAATAADDNPAASSTNKLGLELYQLFATDPGNLCLSPYSIQSAFAMTANGAAGKTLEEMRGVLHYPQNPGALNSSFSTLAGDFLKRHERAAAWTKRAGKGEPAFQLMVANRLFGQKGYPFTPAFLKTLEDSYRAPLQIADFEGNPDGERKTINQWVEGQTRERIKDLLPDGSLDDNTRLVLVNALYFKAAWQHKFTKSATSKEPFHLDSAKQVGVDTMRVTKSFGYSKEDGYTALTLPYSAGFVMLLVIPDEIDGLAGIDRKLSAEKLASLARLPTKNISLHFPKFKIEGGTIQLKKSFATLGMKLAFDRKLADFGPMTSDKSLPGLYIDNAYHKTFIAVDEDGTEAAAATAVVMAQRSAMRPPAEPIEVRVDRPFFYSIMDTNSRTALFLGRVTDPR